METTKRCYGEMFPDMGHFERNRRVEGHAVSASVASVGAGVQGRTVTVNPEGWEECRHCSDYRTCYDLSMARLSIENALRSCG